MTSKSVQMTWRSRLAVAVGLGLTAAAAACSDGANTATSPSAVSPSSLATNAANGESTRNFSVTITPTSVSAGRRNPACDRHKRRNVGTKPEARFG